MSSSSAPLAAGARGAPRASRWIGLLDRLQKLDTYGMFLDPVDAALVPDYADIVREPMHFQLMQSRLATGRYGGPASDGDAAGAAGLAALEADFRLIAANAMLYNKPDTPYYAAAQSMLTTGLQRIANARSRLGACAAAARAACAPRARTQRGYCGLRCARLHSRALPLPLPPPCSCRRWRCRSRGR